MTAQRDLLDREIGTPPPSTIDIEALIVRQRRRVRLRRAGVGGCVIGLVLVIGAVFTFLPGAGRRDDDIDVGASPSTRAVQPSPQSREAEAARLTVALQQLLAQLLPGATLAKAPPSMPGEPAGEPLVFVDHGTHFSAAAVVTDAAGTGTIRVSVGKEDTQFRTDRGCMEGPYPLDVRYQCEVNPGADGSSIMRVTSDIGDDNYRRFYVEIIKGDDSAVSVDVSNGVIENDRPYHGQRSQPLLTMEQAVALVQEPSLATAPA